MHPPSYPADSGPWLDRPTSRSDSISKWSRIIKFWWSISILTGAASQASSALKAQETIDLNLATQSNQSCTFQALWLEPVDKYTHKEELRQNAMATASDIKSGNVKRHF